MSFDVTLVLPGLVLLLALALLWQGRRLRQLELQLEQLESAQAAQQGRQDAFDTRLEQAALDASAVRVSTLGLGRQLERHERSLGLLESHLGSMQRGGAQESSYAQAIRQAARGQIGVEELVQDYGLPRGEAELLLRMHRQNGEV